MFFFHTRVKFLNSVDAAKYCVSAMSDFFDPNPEQQVIVLVEAATLRQAERLIETCEQCNEEVAKIPSEGF